MASAIAVVVALIASASIAISAAVSSFGIIAKSIPVAFHLTREQILVGKPLPWEQTRFV